MKNVDYERLASQVRRVAARYPLRITRPQFIEGCHGVLNNSEAHRLMDAMCNKGIVVMVNKTTYKFNIKQEDITVPGMIELFTKYPIQVKRISPWQSASPQKRAEMQAKRAATIAAKTLPPSLESFSDEALLAELNRREQERTKRAKLQLILETAEISLDELKALIEL